VAPVLETPACSHFLPYSVSSNLSTFVFIHLGDARIRTSVVNFRTQLAASPSEAPLFQFLQEELTMRASKNFGISLLVLAASIALCLPTFAQNDSVLYFFPGGEYGGQPWGNLVLDSHGNLYGTASSGGQGAGVVFELTPASGGGWNESVIYSFGSRPNDGAMPIGALVFDAAGNLYGLTNQGGSNSLGTVYELSPAAGGGWTEQVLYNFKGGSDVAAPNSSLVFDTSGNLFGSSAIGGIYNMGGIFELSPEAGGGWTEQVILAGNRKEGGNFLGPVAVDSHGALYVEAALSGAYNAGSVYRLALVSGLWKANVIHAFANSTADGNEPSGGLVIGPPNHISGVTQAGGTHGDGVAFQLVQKGTGSWTETILHNFGDSPTDGKNPQAGLTLGPVGRLYGTAFAGGTKKSGTVFVLSDNTGAWVETTLHNFNSTTDVGFPSGGVIENSDLTLFGMGYNGGSSGMGGVYQLP
jgi:uncharacterized repeat protein (TIGR03803 family)